MVGCKKKRKSNFISNKTLKLFKERNHLFKLYKKTDLSMDFERYKELRNKVVNMIRDDKEKSNQELVNNFKCNLKAFYGFVRSIVVGLRQSCETMGLHLGLLNNIFGD